MTIRDARVEDAAALVSAERAIALRPGFLASRPEELLEEAFRSTIQTLAGSPDGKYVVAESDGQVVGHANLVPMAFASTKHIVRLTIVVHPGHEGQGIGKRLLSALIEWARVAPGVRKIELNVRSTNTRAIQLYHSMGFVDEARHLDRIRIDEHTFLDDLEMGLFVKPRARSLVKKKKVAAKKAASSTTSSFRQPSKAGAVKASGADASKQIDKRIRDLGDWRGETLARMRALILEADPKITEEWKWMCPVWSRDGIVCTGEAYKNVVKLTFAHGAKIADPKKLFNAGLGGGTRRAIDIPEGETVDAAAFKALIKAAVARNVKD